MQIPTHISACTKLRRAPAKILRTHCLLLFTLQLNIHLADLTSYTFATMKLSTTAAVLALAAAQGANAIDFDFRNFEGLWESDYGTLAVDGGAPRTTGLGTLATVTCEATGDFRKAMCEMTAVVNDFVSDAGLPLCNAASPNLDIEGKWILDQFDADTGETKVLMLNTKCCNPAAAAGAECAAGPDLGIGASMINAQFTMLPGKNNNYVRAIDGKVGGGTDEPFDAYEIDLQLRRTAGGFKAYD